MTTTLLPETQTTTLLCTVRECGWRERKKEDKLEAGAETQISYFLLPTLAPASEQQQLTQHSILCMPRGEAMTNTWNVTAEWCF